ncbi:MAG TPA: 5'-nucleotidase C-terminal domain-containing protein [Roseiflexaceae bacterium]|nr:5'-nucleotidase C-terminal domain-containing protein [Roseiflexaceae bacterium]
MTQISRRTFIRRMAVSGGTLAWLCTGIEFAHAAGPEAYKLRIIHTNDHHARIEPVTGGTPPAPVHGGVSRRKTLIDAIRDEGGNQLLIDAGDVFQGTLWFNQYLGMADLEFYHAMGYEAMAIGNHEFDKGQEPLAEFIKRAQFPVLSANIATDGSSPINGLYKPWIVREVGGQKIGIFGLTTEETSVISSPGAGITFTNYIDAARKAVADLKAQGVSKIIALTHIGITFDRELARQVDGIQVIIGGHSHTPMGPQIKPADPSRPYPEVIASPSNKPVIMATDWEWGRWLGDLTVGFDANGDITSVVAAHPTEVLPSVEPNQGFEDRIKVLGAPLTALRTKVVGEAAVPLNGARADVRTKETNFGNLIADAMLEKGRPAGAQVAIMNGGGIRTSVDAGPITLGELLEVQPFGNQLSLVTLTGAQLKEALENGVSQIETVAGRFAQVSNMRYSFDPARPIGDRVTGVQIGDGKGGYSALDPAGSYRLATINFLVTGGDGYTVFSKGANRLDTGLLDIDVTTEYITAHSPVSPQVEGRIVVGGTLPGAAATAPTKPAQLPNTGGDLTPLWLLAALGASAMGVGARLRGRARHAQPATTEIVEQEAIEEQIEIAG